MVRLNAPPGCNEVAHDKSYPVQNGIAVVPESLVATLVRSHGFTLCAEIVVHEPEHRKVLSIGKKQHGGR